MIRLAALCAVLAGPANALSCLAPSVERSFNVAQAATESYVVAAGKLDVDLPFIRNDALRPDIPDPAPVVGTFTGKALGISGFNTAFTTPVAVQVRCVASWCGGLSDAEEVIVFLQKTDQGYLLEVEPCGGWVFDRTGQQEWALTQCLRGGACDAD